MPSLPIWFPPRSSFIRFLLLPCFNISIEEEFKWHLTSAKMAKLFQLWAFINYMSWIYSLSYSNYRNIYLTPGTLLLSEQRRLKYSEYAYSFLILPCEYHLLLTNYKYEFQSDRSNLFFSKLLENHSFHI